jgi:hypothetical protein
MVQQAAAGFIHLIHAVDKGFDESGEFMDNAFGNPLSVQDAGFGT